MDSSPTPIEVGYPIDFSNVLLKPAGENDWWLIAFDKTGFLQTHPTIWYVGPGCTGAAYMSFPTNIARPATVGYAWGTEVLYQTGPVITGPITISSTRFTNSNTCGGTPGPPFDTIFNVAPVLTRPLSDFMTRPEGTLTPPFQFIRR